MDKQIEIISKLIKNIREFLIAHRHCGCFRCFRHNNFLSWLLLSSCLSACQST